MCILKWSFIWIMAHTVTTGHASNGQKHFICKRLVAVLGDQDKQNDVIFCRNSTNPIKHHVIFFGGDVQDYPENMESHRDNVRYIDWNLENTGKILIKRFPDSAVFIIKPKEMFLRTFSVYSNFVEFSENGVPIHSHDYGGLLHLVKLYFNAISSVESEMSNEGMDKTMQSGDSGTCDKDGCSSDIPISLIGFSKGCVVLNQLLHELELTESNEDIKRFMSKVKSIYWLDGGHNGSDNTWVTDDDILKRLAGFRLKIFAHVTPYQVNDPMRAWIGKEEKKFVTKLKTFGADLKETKHHTDSPRSIENHFDVLKEF